jgi:hypothetical protein
LKAFREKTGTEYGLEIDKEVDERYHLIKASEAACKYLNHSYEKFNNWTLVAASYNAGQRRITEAVEDQFAKNYYHLYLNDETSRYIYRILAIKAVFNNPLEYGFKLEKGDLYDPIRTKSIKVTSTIKSLPAFARKNKVSYRMLKELNPWLRSDKLTVKRGDAYYIDIPR